MDMAYSEGMWDLTWDYSSKFQFELNLNSACIYFSWGGKKPVRNYLFKERILSTCSAKLARLVK